MFYQRVRYTLTDDVNGDYELKVDPIGWKEQVRGNSRSYKNLGFTAKYGDGITFVKDGADRIGYILQTQGKKAKVKFRRDERHPVTDAWVLGYENYIDLHSVSQVNDQITVDFIETGLKTIISDLFKEKFELDRETDKEGRRIEPLDYDILNNGGRKVLKQSFSKNKDAYGVTTNNPYQAIDTTIVYNDDKSLKSTFSNTKSRNIGLNSSFTQKYWNLNQSFYHGNSDAKLKIRFDVDFTVSKVPGSGALKIGLSYGNIDDYGQVTTNNDSDITLFYKEGLTKSTNHISFTKEIDFNMTSGLYLGIYIEANVSANGFFKSYKFKEGAVKIYIKEDSVFEKTSHEGLLLSDAIDRWLYIATGKNGMLVNNMRASSIFSNTLISSGLQIRNFPRVDRNRVVEENPLVAPEPIIESTIKVSLEDLISYKAVEPFDWNVEGDRFHIKPFSDLFSTTTGLVLEEYTNPKRSFATDFIYGKVIIGNEKAGDYEEQVGLYEYNTMTEWLTVEERSENELKLISKLRLDPIGVEWARRVNITVKPTEDYNADSDIFAFHVKKDTDGNYTLRLWEDDLEVAPQVYDPESAYNLMLSPANCFKRWGFLIKTGLTSYPNDYVRFINSKGYDKMVTKQFGQPAIIENQDHKNKDLGKPIFKDEIIEIEVDLKFDEIQSMNDMKFMEKRVQLNKTGEYGFVMESSVEGGKGIFKLIKSI